MAQAIDIRFNDEDDDLFIDSVNGDFNFTESDTRHVDDLVQGYAGWWRESPFVGVGAIRYSASSGSPQRLKRDAKIQLVADGYNVTTLKIEDQELFITGNRNDVNL